MQKNWFLSHSANNSDLKKIYMKYGISAKEAVQMTTCAMCD